MEFPSALCSTDAIILTFLIGQRQAWDVRSDI